MKKDRITLREYAAETASEKEEQVKCVAIIFGEGC